MTVIRRRQPMHQARGRRGVRRATVLTAVVAVIASYSLVSPSSAFAAALSGSNFEIDDPSANLVVDDDAPAIDWLAGGSGSDMRSGVIVRDDRPSGSDDDSFTQGTNINDTPTTITTGGIPPEKSDLTHFGIYVDRQANDTFINVFWTRVQAPNGTTTMDFEFNQSAVRSNGISPPHNTDVDTHTIPLRTTGDILITYFLEKGGTHPTLTKRSWTGTAWGTPTAFSASDALAAINTSAISAANSDGVGPLDPLTFGEASMRLSAFVPSSDTCTTFGSVYLRSRSSATDTDENKDFIAPEPVTISNCGSVRIVKSDTEGLLAGAGFTLYKDVEPVGGARGTGDTVVAGTCGPTAADGVCSIADVKKGEYWLVETTVPAGHDAVADQHVSITAGSQVVSFELDDPIQRGTIRVTKIGVPPDGTNFNFTLDGDPFQLDDDTTPALPNTRDFTVLVGSHSLAEVDIPSGWALTALSCVDPTSNTTTSLADASASVNVAKNELVACTFTDSYAAQGVPITTQATQTQAGGSWNDTATLTGDGSHAVTGVVAFYACTGQATPTGCAEGGTKVGTDVPVAVSGSTFTATTSTPYTPPAAGWTCFRADYTSSSPYYSNGSHTNTTTECFLERNDALTVSTTATPAFGRAYSWTIEKGVSTTRQEIAAGGSATFDYTVTVGNTHTDSAWTVAGLVTVSNPNGVAFSGVAVTESLNNGGTCTVPGGTGVTVPAQGSVQLAYSCTYVSAPAPSAGTSTATATWDATSLFTEASSASGTAAVSFAEVSPSTTDESVVVTDSVVGPLGTVNALSDPNPKVFTYAVTVPGVAGTCTTYDNTARFVASDTQATGSSSKSVVVCVGGDLTASNTAAGSFDRSYAWTIDKSVDNATLTLPNGQDGTFNYTVTVRPAGITESNHLLGGSVTVTNPNDWEDLAAAVAVTADLGGGVTCALTGGSAVVVPMGSSVTLPYTCAFTGVPATTGSVTATVTWAAAELATPSGSASSASAVELAVASETSRTIAVVDDKTDPANPVSLGSATYDDGEASFTYALTQTGVEATGLLDPACVDYNNIATIVETAQNDSQVATLCHTFTAGGGILVVNPTQGGGLPTTGDAIGLLARSSAGLLLAGLLLLMVSRKRRSA